MARPAYAHVYDTTEADDEKYVGFFMSRKDAETWVKKQKRDALEIRDAGPVQAAKMQQKNSIDAALDNAIAAAKAEEAKDDTHDQS